MSLLVRERAPAKVNLYLRVVGRRADGYHLLDSLVAFTALGDTVEVRPAPGMSLALAGPFAAAVPADDDNLVLRAAASLQAAAGVDAGAAIRLVKRIPVAAGLGGGSADAAAALRALRRLWRVDPALDMGPLAAALGADVPMCLAGVPARVGGVGEIVTPTGPLPAKAILLANPGVPLATPAVFRARSGAFAAAAPPDDDPVGAIAREGNDLTAAAITLVPAIADVLAALAAAGGCRVARMSGSGATCFGLFDDPRDAGRAARRLRRRHPGWWIAATRLAG
ncbi:MAG: 4-(cytidine 5'-diphospho)-2-C-methyl-D-erythritol kinase [Alphaproteobacteria bacterium]|nr:4-(cytidine 5'-diphospho)-2-C-methyl-D-erythritol kinase [Alphaproteobacteria bacterium]